MFGRKRHKEIINLLAELRRDQEAAHSAMKRQLGEVHGRIEGVLTRTEDTNARLSFQRRPKP